MGAGRLHPPSEFDPDREAILHFPWSRFQSCKLTPDLMSTTRSVWFFVIALTVIRLSMLATTDLEFDEAHYWMWSERLAPAYFSKGPGIAFAMRASTAIFGANEFGVRFFSPVLAAGTSLLMFYFARRLFSASAGLCTVLALNVTPIFNIGAFLMTIDSLSVFFWLAAMFTFWLALERSPRFSWHWPLTGLLVGLGFLSKYTNALELVSIMLVLVLARRLRQEFARPGLYLLLGVFGLFAVPVSRAGLGRDRKLAAGESTIQSTIFNVVWFAGVRFLLSLVD